MRKKRTNDEFIKEMKSINSNIEFLSEYTGIKDKIHCKCKIDGYEWYTTPDSLLHGKGCHKCSGKMKKTHEDFLIEMNNIHPNIDVLEEYKNSKTKILCQCKIDKHKWYVKPSNLLIGQGCPKCAGRVKRTQEEFVKEIKLINPSIEIRGTYVDTKTKIECYCPIHNHTWNPTANALLNGQGCILCGYDKLKQLKQYSHEEFVNIMKDRNPNVKILSKYYGKKEKVDVKCDICNYSWSTSGNSLLQGKGCPKCGGSLKKTNEEFESELKNAKPHIIPIEKYNGALTNIKFRCLIHNREWYDTPVHVLRDRGCPECAKESYRELRMKKHDDYVREVKEIHKNIDVIGEYCGANSKILFRCNECGYEWESYPFNILKGCGCPRCARIGNSKLQEKVNEYISKVYQYKLLHEYECNLKPRNPKTNYIMPFDNELVELKLIIEVHGQQHYEITGFTKLTAEHYGTTEDEELEYQKWKDKYKKDYALDNGYSYLEIPYWTEKDESYKTLIDNKINEILQEAV